MRDSLAERVSVEDFRNDPMFRRIECVVAELLTRGNVVAPVDVLVGMGLLRPEHLGDWRRGRLPYLERVINCNLTRLSRLLRILRFHAHDLNLKPSATVYNRYGKGTKQRLRFSKTGDAGLEAAYATHSYGRASGRSTHREPRRWRRPTPSKRVRSAYSWNGPRSRASTP